MGKTLYDKAKTILKFLSKVKIILKKTYFLFRTRYLKKRYPDGRYIECNGAKVFCDFNDENYSWYDGKSKYLKYELEVFTSLFERKKPDVILDVGAHWGFYSAFLDNIPFFNKTPKVISLEADPMHWPIIERTLSNIQNIDVKQINAAVSDKDGFIDLYSGKGTCKQSYYSEGSIYSKQVRAISLDSLVEKYLEKDEVLTHVKVDIDGYEPAFFAGGKKTLKKYKPIIMVEFWAKGLKESGWNVREYWNMLQNNYCVQEADFSKRSLLLLKQKDISYLIEKTNHGITNLVLIPKEE